MVPLALLMLVALLLLIGGTILLMAHAVLRPPRMTDGKALYLLQRVDPGDLGIPFERMTFTVRDEPTGKMLDLAAWWMAHPAGGDKTVILLHGYADAKVGAIAWAPTWRALGYHILALDLRAHGESGGRYMTAGIRERQDVDQALNQLRAVKPAQTSHLVLFGISLGGIVALATTAMRDDIAAIVLESPVSRFRSGLRAHSELLGLPLPSLLPVVLQAAQWISGADFDAVHPLELIHRSKCPVMLITSNDDPFLPAEEASELRNAVKSRSDHSVVWNLDGVAHLMALQQDPSDYKARIEAFLATLARATCH